MSVLRVELFYDQEASNWHYRVPALHINGGGTPTRADASRNTCLPSRSRWKATPRRISNALNEVLHGPEAIPEWEFQSRIGGEKLAVEALLTKVSNRMDELLQADPNR
jgi:hypothetical protein